VPVEEVPEEAPVDESDELDPLELVEPDCVLEVESLDVEPDWVELVPVEDWAPVANVVDVVEDVARVPLAVVVVPFAGSLGAAPPRLNVIAVPPVVADVTLTITVVVVVDLVRVAGEVDALEGVCAEPLGSVARGECAAGVTGGTATGGTPPLSLTVTAGADGVNTRACGRCRTAARA
jgi:hypothetical protein